VQPTAVLGPDDLTATKSVYGFSFLVESFVNYEVNDRVLMIN